METLVQILFLQTKHHFCRVKHETIGDNTLEIKPANKENYHQIGKSVLMLIHNELGRGKNVLCL